MTKGEAGMSNNQTDIDAAAEDEHVRRSIQNVDDSMRELLGDCERKPRRHEGPHLVYGSRGREENVRFTVRVVIGRRFEERSQAARARPPLSNYGEGRQGTIDYYLGLPFGFNVRRIGDSFFAEVAELPGCMTYAGSFGELEPMIQDAMIAWILDAIAEGDAVPEPSPGEHWPTV